MMKILVVRYRFIGDTILTVPFLRNLRSYYPNAQIDMLVAPNSGEVIENCPYVDNFIYFDTTRKHKYENGESKKRSFLSYVIELHREHYDKAYILKRSLSSALLCYFAGIKERIGYDTEHRGFLLTNRVKYDRVKHESLCFLDVLKADNIPIKDRYLENWVSESAVNRANRLLVENGIGIGDRFAVVNAAASNPNKMWDIENFAQVVEYLAEEKGIKTVFIGAISDKGLYNKMKLRSDLVFAPVNLCGQVSIQDSLAILKRAEFLLGNDSGNLHMASSVGTRVIGIYGPMPFEKWYALGGGNILLRAKLPCMPCSLKKKCKNHRACMYSISVESVKKAIDNMLSDL